MKVIGRVLAMVVVAPFVILAVILVIAAWVSLALFYLAAVTIQWLDANGFDWRFL